MLHVHIYAGPIQEATAVFTVLGISELEDDIKVKTYAYSTHSLTYTHNLCECVRNLCECVQNLCVQNLRECVQEHFVCVLRASLDIFCAEASTDVRLSLSPSLCVCVSLSPPSL
jgi:hypothetical protein